MLRISSGGGDGRWLWEFMDANPAVRWAAIIFLAAWIVVYAINAYRKVRALLKVRNGRGPR